MPAFAIEGLCAFGLLVAGVAYVSGGMKWAMRWACGGGKRSDLSPCCLRTHTFAPSAALTSPLKNNITVLLLGHGPWCGGRRERSRWRQRRAGAGQPLGRREPRGTPPCRGYW